MDAPHESRDRLCVESLQFADITINRCTLDNYTMSCATSMDSYTMACVCVCVCNKLSVTQLPDRSYSHYSMEAIKLHVWELWHLPMCVISFN
jgi:hypothetical protein